jgi:hypothetical protein
MMVTLNVCAVRSHGPRRPYITTGSFSLQLVDQVPGGLSLLQVLPVINNSSSVRGGASIS